MCRHPGPGAWRWGFFYGEMEMPKFEVDLLGPAKAAVGEYYWASGGQFISGDACNTANADCTRALRR
jgi:hypothetical protein